MPKSWYDKHAVMEIGDEENRKFYESIMADKKPYFMTYIYPTLRKDYKKYHDAVNARCKIEFGITIDELEKMNTADMNDAMKGILGFYHERMPVGIQPCLMNKICRKFEDAFDKRTDRLQGSGSFDYGILKSDAEYSMDDYYKVSSLMKDYNRAMKDLATLVSVEKISSDEISYMSHSIGREFRESCTAVCPDDKQLCNIVLDLCYTKSTAKRFAWEMCGRTICANLLEKNGNRIMYPEKNPDGDISYGGDKFSLREINLEAADDSAE